MRARPTGITGLTGSQAAFSSVRGPGMAGDGGTRVTGAGAAGTVGEVGTAVDGVGTAMTTIGAEAVMDIEAGTVATAEAMA